MASLEDYLRNFAKAGSGFAFPSERCIIIESFAPATEQGNREYVPPENGLCVIWLEGTQVDAEIRKDGGIQTLAITSAAPWAKACVPCTRGQRIYYAIWGAFKQGEFYFVPSLGSQ